MPRRLTDRSLPTGLSSISPDVNLFDDLMEVEKRLDWTIARRRQEITDTINRGALPTKRTLRIFMSHTVKNQSWQEPETSEPKTEEGTTANGEADADKVKLETGAGVPSWTFKIEGKLLAHPAVPTSKRTPAPQRRFSHLVRSIAIEMDRDPSIYADTNHVQWVADQRYANYNLFGAYASPQASAPESSTNSGAAPLDGFTITRSGDIPTTLRLTVHLNHYPERVKVTPGLATVLGIHEDTRANIAGAFWHYVKSNGLQDKNDRKLIRLDDGLREIFKYESLNFQDIQVLLASHMMPADPIVLQYEIGTHNVDDTKADVDMDDPSAPATSTPGGIGANKDGQSAIKAYDVELEMDDLWMRAKAADVVLNMQPESVALSFGITTGSSSHTSLQKADDDIKTSLQNLRAQRIRRDFFIKLAEQPSKFIQEFVESQARDLEVVMGNERAAEGAGAGGNASMGSGMDGGLRETDLLNSEYFKGEWANEAVGVYEGLRMGGAVSTMYHAQAAQMQLHAHGHGHGQGMHRQNMGGHGMQM